MRSTEIEDIYPLTPLQQGMLLQILGAPEQDLYIEQVTVLVTGPLDEDRLEDAWNRVVQATPVLRTAFVEEGLRRPRQVVVRSVTVPVRSDDWRDRARDERAWRALRVEERRAVADHRKAPLMRLALVRVGHDTWRVLWTYHHLVLDAWSAALVLSDVVAAYRGAALPKRPRFRDYVRFVLESDVDGAVDRLKARLDQWPGSRSLTEWSWAAPQGAWRVVERELDGRAATIRAREAGVTPAIVGFAAWAATLARFVGSPDVTFGVTTSGRPPKLPGATDIVGLCIQAVPLMVRLGLGEDVDATLRSVAAEMQEVQPTGYAPLPAAAARSALFDTLVVYDNTRANAVELDRGIRLGPVDFHTRSGHPVTLMVRPKGDGILGLRLFYDGHHIGRRRAEQLLDGLERALAALGTARRFYDVLDAVAPDAARPDRSPPGPAESTPWTAFVARSRASPKAVALIDGERTLTYEDLERRAAELAHGLAGRGVGPGAVVGSVLPRGADAVALALATWCVGGTLLPLGSRDPTERVTRRVQHAGPAIVVDPDAIRRLGRDGGPLADRSDPRGAAYVMYTSGSTGPPKGVVVEHRGLMAHVAARSKALDLRSEDRVAHLAAPFFDISVWEWLAPLCVGGTVVVLGREAERDPEVFVRGIRQAGVTVAQVVPTTLEMWLDAARRQAMDVRALRWLVSAGEPLPVDLCEDFSRRYPTVSLLNAYAPTETSDLGCSLVLEGGVELGAGSVPVGRPAPGMSAYVLGPGLLPMPSGHAGEVYLSGVGVGRGYLADPRRTAAAFLPDPFAAVPGSRMYRTGDLARVRKDDGVLVHLGRTDRQLKVRGVRIEPGEVEAVLRSDPDVGGAWVGSMGTGASTVLVAAVVPARGRSIDVDGLRTRLVASLPERSRPSRLEVVSALPTLPNGKVDGKKLARDLRQRPAGSEEGAGRLLPHERTIADAWEAVLGASGVEATSDFLELGGQSIALLHLRAELQRSTGRSLSLTSLWEARTVREQAALLDDGESASPPSSALSWRSRGTHPLAASQLAVWHLFTAGVSLTVSGVVDIEGDVDFEALVRSSQRLVDRHWSLRSVAELGTSGPRMRVASLDQLRVDRVDLSGRLEPVRQAQVAGRDFLSEPIDVRTGPITRLRLLKLGERRFALAMSSHHIASDGRSMNIQARELMALYRQESGLERKGVLPEVLQFGDFATYQVEQPDRFRERLERSIAVGADAPRGLRIFGEGRGVGRHPVASKATFAFDVELASRLREVAKALGATPYQVVFGALAAVLYEATGRRDLCFGVMVSGRDEAWLAGIVGAFANVALVRVLVQPDASFRELVATVRTALLDAMTRDDVPVALVRRELQSRYGRQEAPAFVSVGYACAVDVPSWADGPRMSLGAPDPDAPFDPQSMGDAVLSYSFTETGDEILGSLLYRQGQSRWVVDGLTRGLRDALDTAIGRLDQPIATWGEWPPTPNRGG